MESGGFEQKRKKREKIHGHGQQGGDSWEEWGTSGGISGDGRGLDLGYEHTVQCADHVL